MKKTSCICLTYGRPRHLAEALACFLNQDYPEKELIIYNTYPRQTITGNWPQVKIFNCTERPSTLGKSRNLAIELATGDIMMPWDDDNLYMPWLLAAMANAFEELAVPWVRVDPVWYSERWKIKSAISWWPNAVSCTMEAWNKVGRYDDINQIEDKVFALKLRDQLPGVVKQFKPQDIPIVYCWDNEVLHASGHGVEGNKTAYQDSAREIEERRGRGLLTPTLELFPSLVHDPVKIAAEFLASDAGKALQPSA